MIWVLAFIALIVLILGSLTDLKKREVYDYLSYGLIFVAFGISIIYTIIYSDYKMILDTALGFILGLIIAYAMFYLGQWGGGDSKLIMGLGAVIGFNIFGEKNYWFIMLLINILFVGALYGLVWSIALAIKHRKEFMKNLKKWTDKKQLRIARIALLIFTIIACAVILYFISDGLQLMMLSLVATIFVVFYLWLFVKVIEESCMIKQLPISKLTEGDWVYKNVYIDKKYVAGPKDLGISREQIALLKKFEKHHKIKTVPIKEGIPFIPAFLIAYITTLIMYYLNVFSYIRIGLF